MHVQSITDDCKTLDKIAGYASSAGENDPTAPFISRERLPGITEFEAVGLIQLIDIIHRTAIIFELDFKGGL